MEEAGMEGTGAGESGSGEPGSYSIEASSRKVGADDRKVRADDRPIIIKAGGGRRKRGDDDDGGTEQAQGDDDKERARSFVSVSTDREFACADDTNGHHCKKNKGTDVARMVVVMKAGGDKVTYTFTGYANYEVDVIFGFE